MEIKIECDRNDCKNCQEGQCGCKELILQVVTEEFDGRSPGSGGRYHHSLLTCGSYEPKS